MRIAHISDCYLPRTGGIELQVRGLSQAQKRAGNSPEIITATPAARGQAVIAGETDDGVPIHRLAVDLPASLPVTPHVGKRLTDLLADVDVVHVHGGLISVFAWPALRAAVKAGKPAVVSVHSVWSGWSGVFGATNLLTGWRSWPVIWTGVSDVAAEPMREALGGRQEVRILGNGIDVERWKPEKPVHKNTDEITIVTVQRLAIRKRGLALVEILEQARALIPASVNVRAVIIGDGPDRNRIESALDHKGMGWVTCAGWQNHDQIREHYRNADIYICPTLLESFGIAALEARTSGLPVVALANSGVNSFITDGVEGLLERDDAGLAYALSRLSTDDALRRKITTHNRTVEPPFGWPTILDEATSCYEAAIALRAKK